MGKEIHPRINHAVISRNREWFNSNTGVGFFDPSFSTRRIGIENVPEKNHWLVEETENLWKSIMVSPESLLLTGDLGEGKSALIYGLRATSRMNDCPYVYVDGHFQESPTSQLRASLQWAKKNNAPIFWDSLDYLIAEAKKIRKIPINELQDKGNIILNELIQFINFGGKLIGTSHTSTWLEGYCNANFTNGKWQLLLNSLKNYKVIGFLQPKEIHDFYSAAGFTPTMAYLMGEIATQEGLRRCRQVIQMNKALAQNEDELIGALNKYKIAKLLALATDNQSYSIRLTLNNYILGHIDESIFLTNLFNYILYENSVTLKKNGALKQKTS